MRTRRVLALISAGLVLLALPPAVRAGEKEDRERAEALRKSAEDKIVSLESKIEGLKATGASEGDLRLVDQLLRIARGSVKQGQWAEAEANAASGLKLIDQLAEEVRVSLAARIAKMDERVRFLLDDAREYLTRKPPEEEWARGRYREAVKLAEERNALARTTGGQVAVADFGSLFAPYRGRLEQAAAPAVSSPIASETPESKVAKDKYADLVLRVRGNEPDLFRDAVSNHLQGKYAEAKREYGRVLQGAPADYKTLFNLGLLEMQLGNPSAALGPLRKAFEIGLKMDSLDLVWKGNFVPDVGPLKEACLMTGNAGLAAEVEAAWSKRREEIALKQRKEKEARIPKLETPTPPPVEGEEVVDESQLTPEERLKRKLRGKVMLAQPGTTPQEVTDLIGPPDDVKMKGNTTLYYYSTGTVVFVDGKVKESEMRFVDLNEIP